MIFIGIDPDTQKSGFAVWDTNKRNLLDFKALAFWDLISQIKIYIETYSRDNVKIVLEAGWLNKNSNFHYHGPKVNVREKIAHGVGRNHEIGMLFEEFCKKYHFNYELFQPKRKKFTSEFVLKAIGLEIKNQDIIDAVMLVFGK